jgi:DEAD/DEAH box helicase domain-containing protein
MAYPKRTIVLDLETQKGFNEVDRSKLHLLKVSVVGIYDSYDDLYLAFEEKEMARLEERLKLAELIVGFNIRGFDLKVLEPYLLTDVRRFRVLDLLDEIQKSIGHRVSLQSLAQATFRDSKSGTGWNAIQLFKDGRIEDLKRYCLDDVRLTKRIYDYGIEHKKVFFFSNRDFSVREIPVNWGTLEPEPEATGSSFPTSLF